MPAKVAVLQNKSLFAAGIERRLQDAGTIDVVRLSGDLELLRQEIGELNPDIIVIDCAAADNQIEIAVACILAAEGFSTVIKLGLDCEEMIVHRTERQPLVTGEDLVAAIGRLVEEGEVGEGGGDCMQGD
ncbi:MAG: hypothetical protein ACE5M4_05855 [Anaerolineales bacterium]